MHNFVSNCLSIIALFNARRNVWKHNPSLGVGSCFAHAVHKHSCEFIQRVHGSSMHVCVSLFNGFGHVVFVQDGVSYWPGQICCCHMHVCHLIQDVSWFFTLLKKFLYSHSHNKSDNFLPCHARCQQKDMVAHSVSQVGTSTFSACYQKGY